jgi:CheY-like chemotaxis protein
MMSCQKILLVEDDAETRRLMAMWLDAQGYDVRTASNGREALALLREEAPCLMVVDLNMPVMDGAELRRRQLQMASISDVPFVLVSAAQNAEQVAHDLGIADVILKPFDAELLLRIVGSHCHRAH